MGAVALDHFLRRLDQALDHPAEITVMGASILIALGMRDRQTMNVDVWAEVNSDDAEQVVAAAREANIPISSDSFDEPEEPYLQIVDRRAAHMPLNQDWLEGRTPVWSGNLLTVLAPSLELMAASKLSLGRDRDLDDVRFLFSLDPCLEDRILEAAQSFSQINKENILGNLEVTKIMMDSFKPSNIKFSNKPDQEQHEQPPRKSAP